MSTHQPRLVFQHRGSMTEGSCLVSSPGDQQMIQAVPTLQLPLQADHERFRGPLGVSERLPGRPWLRESQDYPCPARPWSSPS